MAQVPSYRPLLIAAFLLSCIAQAQPPVPPGLPNLMVTVQVMPPYNASYASYFQVPGQVLINIFNPDPVVRLVYLNGSIATTDGQIAVSSTGRNGWTAPIVVPQGVTALSSTQVEPFLQGNASDIQFTGITETDIRSGLLPEGEYQICLQAIDWLTETMASQPEPLGCSNTFTIAYPPAPVTINPICEGTETATEPQMLVFNWILPSGSPPGSVIEYNFRLARWQEGIDELTALQSSVDLVQETQTMQPILSYNQVMAPLMIGQRYVWRVQAVDALGQVVFQNEGYSPPCSFTYLGGTSLFNFAYPLVGDTLPWDFIPIIQRFDPYAKYKYFNSQLTVLENGNSFNFITRLIHWYNGAHITQQALLRAAIPDPNFNMTEYHASHVNIYGPLEHVGNKFFFRGKKYDLSADLEVSLDYYGSNLSTGTITGTFVGGMGRPRPLLPEHEAEIPKNGGDSTLQGFAPVELRFKTAEAPARLTPPYPIWYLPEGGGSAVQVDGTIDERWVLEVSRTQDFQVPVASEDGRLGAGMHLPSRDHLCEEDCLRDQLYKEVSYQFTPEDTGTYYWRVKWMLDPNMTAGEAYHEGPIRKFRITAPTTPEQPVDSIRPAECMASCEIARVPLEERVPIDTVQINDIVKVGAFDMKVTQITWTANKASGQGTIPVPFMSTDLKVSFQNISINHQMKMYDGAVKGIYDNADIIPPAWIEGGSLLAGMNQEQALVIESFVNTTGRLVSQLTPGVPMGLPIAIDQYTPEGNLIIGILAMRFTDTLATLNAGMSFPIPDWDFNLSLGNMDVPFRPDGVGCVTQQATLYLLDDIKAGVSSDNDTLLIKATRFNGLDFMNVADSGTFVAWDCRGFRAIQIDGEFRFSQEKLVEDMADGGDGPTKIVGAFKARAGRSGFITRMDFNKPFHVKGGKGWGFEVQEAWLDVASHTNPPNMSIPEQLPVNVQQSPPGTLLPIWKGFYLKRAMVRLPEGIEAFDNPGRVTFIVDDMLLDRYQGLSCSIKAANILGVDEGSLDGWGYSIDTLQLNIVANSFSQAGFKGRIHLPVTDTLLVYSAMVHQTIATDDWYAQFIVQPKSDINAPLWHSTLVLDETSNITATIGHDSLGTVAEMMLHGKITIDQTMPKIGRMNFRDIHFNNLTFRTKAPYTNAGDSATFSFTSPQKWIGGAEDELLPDEEQPVRKVGGFPVSITNIGIDRRDLNGTPMAGLVFDLNLNLTGDVNVFTATTRLALLGELNTTSMHQWGHHSLELDSIGVMGDVGVVKVHGGLRFYEGDATYGDGIKGLLNAEFMKGKLKVRAAMQFGNKDGLRYWFADAMAVMDNGIDVYPGFTIYGFGGGAWYHMQRTSPLVGAQQLTNSQIANQDMEEAPPGLTLTNVTYAPGPNTSYGFQGTMVFGNTGGGTAYNADVTVGATLSSTGGVSTMFLNGNVYFMAERTDRLYNPVHGTAEISYDLPNDVFSANFALYVSLTGGKVTGTGPNDLAGNVELLVTPDTWHLFAGTPTTPIGLDFLGIFETEAYIMIGEDLPPAADPPANVMEAIPANYFTRSAQVQNGNGFAFGARMSVEEKLKFLLLRFNMVAAAGLDIALLDMGETTCHGMGEGGTIGVNGWYAKGQVYAYLSGGVSLYVDIYVHEGEVDIFTVGAAAMLQGGFPDPTWLKGAVSGSYSVLHGAVSGDFTFPFELGEPCDPPNEDILSGLVPIGDLTPRYNDGITYNYAGVDCGVDPSVVFNMKIDTPFDVYQVQDDGSRLLRTFRLKVETFELKEGLNVLNVSTITALTKDQMTLVPAAFLKPNTTHSVRIKLKVEELKNGAWAAALKDGQPVFWDQTNVFRTGAGPDKIIPSYVDYTYPFTGQRFFLQDECRKGVIQLKSDMSGTPVFAQPTAANTVRNYKVLFVPRNGSAITETNATVTHSGKSMVFFDVPELSSASIYAIQLIWRDSIVAPSSPFDIIQASAAPLATMMSAEVTTQSTSVYQGLANLNRRMLSGYNVKANEKLLYDYSFRTSMHRTLAAKAASFGHSGTQHLANPAGSSFEVLQPWFSGEPFDVFDGRGHTFTTGSIAPLVKFSEARTGIWNTNWNQPVIYTYYQNILNSSQNLTSLRLIRGQTVVNGPFGMNWIIYGPDTIGIPPVNTVHFHPYNDLSGPLSQQESAPIGLGAEANFSDELSDGGPANASLYLKVTSGTYVKQDFDRMQTITANIIDNYGSPYAVESFIPEPVRSNMKTFLGHTYRNMYQGNYTVNFHFQDPPGECIPTILYFSSGPTFPPLSGTAVYDHPTGTTPPIVIQTNVNLGNLGSLGGQVNFFTAP